MSDPTYRIRVVGTPHPQGSKKAFINPQTGRPIITEDNPKPLKLWRTAVADTVQQALADGTLERMPGVCRIRVDFIFPPVASDPHRTLVAVNPDVDKLLRATLDALKIGRAIADDNKVAEAWVRKRYAEGDEPAGAVITFVDLSESEAANRERKKAVARAER